MKQELAIELAEVNLKRLFLENNQIKKLTQKKNENFFRKIYGKFPEIFLKIFLSKNFQKNLKIKKKLEIFIKKTKIQ